MRCSAPAPRGGAPEIGVAHGWTRSHIGRVSHPPLPIDPHAALRDRIVQTVLDGPGESDPALRHQAAAGTGLPPDLQALVSKIHRHAYQVSDEDVAKLLGRYGEDHLFEIIVSAALGASRTRLLAGLQALDEACG